MKKHSHCFLCQHCLPEWRLLIDTKATIHQYKKGESIFRAGETLNGFYFIHEGNVKIHKKWKNNRDLIIKFAGPGSVLGHRGLSDHVHPVSATALNRVTLCFVDADFFATTLLVNHELAHQMVLFFASELQKTEQSMSNMVQMDVKSRIALSLLDISNVFGTDQEGFINSSLSKQDIASYAGTTYESLFKTLNEWKDKAIIDLSEKKIKIIDSRKFKELTAG